MAMQGRGGSGRTPKGGKTGGKGERFLTEKVRTARGRSTSSVLWLQRQLNDPYVKRAKQQGYRSRAAYKLIEINEMFKFLKPGARVVDLGAAPGGWTQVIVEKVKPEEGKKGKVIGIDITPVEAIVGAELITCDFLTEEASEMLKEKLQGQADVVLSDMAASSCGHAPTDHLRIMALCEAAFLFAEEVLAPNGVFVAKILQGGTQGELLQQMKQRFAKVRHVKPPASRSDSAEMYVVAIGFKGKDPQ